MHRKTIYRWREKYDGTAKSLKNKSRIPHSHPNEYIQEEIKLIKDYKNKESSIVMGKLRRNGYTGTISSLFRGM